MAEEDFLKHIEEFLDNTFKLSCKLPKYRSNFSKPELNLSFKDIDKKKEEPTIIEKKRKKNGKRKSNELF